MTLTCTNVTLRQKALRNDRISLYLDYYPAIRNPYTMKMSRREFLGIYLYAKPRNEQQRMFNQEMLVAWLGIEVDTEKFSAAHLHRVGVADCRVVIQIE